MHVCMSECMHVSVSYPVHAQKSGAEFEALWSGEAAHAFEGGQAREGSWGGVRVYIHSYKYTHSLTHARTHSLIQIHSLTHSLTHSYKYTHSLTRSLIQPGTHSPLHASLAARDQSGVFWSVGHDPPAHSPSTGMYVSIEAYVFSCTSLVCPLRHMCVFMYITGMSIEAYVCFQIHHGMIVNKISFHF